MFIDGKWQAVSSEAGWPGTNVMIFKNCFWEKRQFVRRKSAKIAENCDHNIDPKLGEFSPIGRLFSLESFLKITEVAEILVLLFYPTVQVMY
jgi:hypothetical protein